MIQSKIIRIDGSSDARINTTIADQNAAGWELEDIKYPAGMVWAVLVFIKRA